MGIHEWSYDNDINDAAPRCPGRQGRKALPASSVEVELGFDAKPAGARRSAASTATCRRCSTACIECDACVDICPMDCITFTATADEADLRTRLKAPAEPGAGSVRLHRADRAPRDGEGRRRLPALRPVRRALPHRRLGHAEDPAAHHAGRAAPAATPPPPPGTSRRSLEHEAHRGGQRLRRQVRQRQRLGFGLGQRAVRQGDHPHGRAGGARATSSPTTSRACRPGTRCGVRDAGWSAGAAAWT